MSDQFKIQEAITFIQQTPPETYRLMDVTIIDIPEAYEHGKVLISASAVDVKVAEDVNIFVMNCATGVTLKVGGTTNPELSNITHFSYKGNKTSFWVSNSGTEDITVSYSTCSL
jgi:hypothetical protein